MLNQEHHQVCFKNPDSMFTEIFSLLKWNKNNTQKSLGLNYSTAQLKGICQHSENAIEVLLQGLQGLGKVISFTTHNKANVQKDLDNLGFFVSIISNLTEALNTLRSDTDYELKQRGVLDH